MNKKRFDELQESVRQGGAILRGELKPSRSFERESAPPAEPQLAWAICLTTDDPKLLIPFKVYRVQLLRENLIGVTDETGEAAIYPSENFLILNLPPSADQRLMGVKSS